jgi:hypothetical protein
MTYTILGIKLVSGEEIIGKVISQTTTDDGLTARELFEGKTQRSNQLLPDQVTLKDVLVIHLQNTPQGVGLGLTAWVLGNQNAELSVNLKQNALTVYKPDPRIEKVYMEQTSSIAIAPAGSVPGL